MDCVKASEYLHSYIDDALSATMRRELEAHLAVCPGCAAELEALHSLSKALRALPREELPPGFSQSLHEALSAEPAPPQPTLWQRGWVKGMAAAACLLLVIGALSVGGNVLRYGDGFGYAGGAASTPAAPAPAPAASAPNEGAMIMQDSISYNEFAEPEQMAEAKLSAEAPMAAPGADTGASADISQSILGEDSGGEQLERKIIKDANLSLRVNDFAAVYQRLNELAARYGGYVVSSDAYSYDGETMQRGYVSLRVDAARLDAALAEIEGMGKLENQSVYTQDVTMTYYDIAGRLTQYQTQEQRLLQIMGKAETVEDLIKLESELTRVRAELESLTGQLRYYDQMTALSSINVNLYQPDANTQSVRLSGWAGFMQDIRAGFISGVNGILRACSNLAVGFFRLLPALLLLAVVVIAVVLMVRKRRK